MCTAARKIDRTRQRPVSLQRNVTGLVVYSGVKWVRQNRNSLEEPRRTARRQSEHPASARAGMTQLNTICVIVFKHRHAPFTPMASIPPRCSRRFCAFGSPHSVVHSMRRRETTEWGQPNETHEKQRNGKQRTTRLERFAFQVFKNVSLIAA